VGGKMRRFMSIMITLFLLSACDDFVLYKGSYPELHSIATHSLLGVFGFESNEIFIMEKDEWGRTLFAFVGSSVYTDEYIIAVLIAQETTKTHSYYYDTYNFIVKECPNYVKYGDINTDFVEQYFTNEEIQQLKTMNDWDHPIQNNLLFEIKITRRKVDKISTSKKRAAFDRITDNYNDQDCVPLATDRNGLTLYLFSERTYNYDEEVHEFGNSYLAMFNKTGHLVSEDSLEILNDLWMYQEQLRAFKAKNGWSFHD
jgi:hypothetical protein